MGDGKMNKENLLKCCIKYVKVINDQHKNGFDYSVDDERTKIHDELCNLFNLHRGDIHPITSNLDVWLGFDSTKKMSTSQIAHFGCKLFNLLSSDFVQNGSMFDFTDKFKELRTAWFDDENFKGWENEDA